MKNDREYLSRMAIVLRKPENRERDVEKWALRLKRAYATGQWGMASKARLEIERLKGDSAIK